MNGHLVQYKIENHTDTPVFEKKNDITKQQFQWHDIDWQLQNAWFQGPHHASYPGHVTDVTILSSSHFCLWDTGESESLLAVNMQNAIFGILWLYIKLIGSWQIWQWFKMCNFQTHYTD